MRIEAIYIAPVKSLGLTSLQDAYLGTNGIDGDRRFFLVDAESRVLTQREFGPLVQLTASYDEGSRRLRFDVPGAASIEDEVTAGEPVTANFYGNEFKGLRAPGRWDEALSGFAARPVRVVEAAAGTAFDVLTVSLCSAASVEEVRRRADAGVAVDERRFRPNFYLSGVPAHGEDAWVGGLVRLGADAIVSVQMRDERCAMTTHSPVTGAIDMNTLKVIASYRTDQPKHVHFGVYGSVAHEGRVAVGDEVTPLEGTAA